MADGALGGMDLWHEIRRAQALLKRQAPPAGGGAGRTAFNALQGSATVTDGTVNNRDLNVDMDYLQVAGRGTLNLPGRKVDYQLITTVSEVPAEEDSAELADLKSVRIPVRISGTLDDLKVRPDLEAQVKAEVEKEVEEKKEELKEKLQERLNKWLKK
jgi:AsmA protein